LKDDGTGGVNQIGDEVKKVIQGEDRNKKWHGDVEKTEFI
jgi:hypothetical protein